MRRLRHFAGRAVAAGALAMAGAAVSAGAASASTVGTCSAQGQYATCDASGTINNPTSIAVAVTASPNQSVFVSWTDTCAKGTGAGGESGSFTAATPVTRTIELPYADPDNCVVAAGAQLQAGGNSVHVQIDSPAPQPPVIPAIKGYDGKCADVLDNGSANGTKIVLWSCDGGAAQQFAFSKERLTHAGKCLNDQANGGSGSKVVLYTCTSAENDLWTHESNGEYVLASHSRKLCLDDPGSSTGNGVQLEVYTCKDTANQRWTLP